MNLAVPPRLVATDLDGTLLDAQGHVSPRTREVLDALDARGVPVVFVTGRPLRWMADLWADVGGHGLAICSNGGVVYDVAGRRVHSSSPLSRPTALDVAERIRAAVPETTFGIEFTTGWGTEPTFPRHPDDTGDAHLVGTLEEIYRDDVVKLLAVHRRHDPEEFWQASASAVGDLVTTTWSSSFALVEISAPGVTKATALADLCAGLGVAAADVVAFGDMPNDLPMLAWAGTSVAMENAHPSVLAAAGARAPRHDEDGVARVLTDLFGL